MQSRQKHKQSGISLVEVIVVVFIIGLVASMIVLTLPDRTPPGEKAAQDFASTLSQAQDYAIMTGEPVGLVIRNDHYGLQVWRRGQWRDTRGGNSLQRRTRLAMLQNRGEKVIEDWPALVFDPTGVSDGAEFELQSGRARFAIRLLPSGALQIDEL